MFWSGFIVGFVVCLAVCAGLFLAVAVRALRRQNVPPASTPEWPY